MNPTQVSRGWPRSQSHVVTCRPVSNKKCVTSTPAAPPAQSLSFWTFQRALQCRHRHSGKGLEVAAPRIRGAVGKVAGVEVDEPWPRRA